jgi:hypothetical protein
VGIFDPKSEISLDWHDITGLLVSGYARLIGKNDPGLPDAFRLSVGLKNGPNTGLA